MTLDTNPRFQDPDAAYRLIVEAHRGLGEEESRKLDAALILILANAVGDLAILKDALELARKAAASPANVSVAANASTPEGSIC